MGWWYCGERKHDSFVRKPFGTSPTEAETCNVRAEEHVDFLWRDGMKARHIRQPQTRVWWIRGFHPPAEGGQPMGCWMHVCMFVKLFSCKVEQAKVNSSKSMRALGGGILQQLCRSCSNSTPFNCIAPAFWASGQFSGIPSFQIHSSHRESRASMNDIPIDDMAGPPKGYGKDWHMKVFKVMLFQATWWNPSCHLHLDATGSLHNIYQCSMAWYVRISQRGYWPVVRVA